VLTIFETVARRRHGVAVGEARDGICTICHVRLRPQVFNTVRRNDEIVQCDSCNRILYYVPAPPAAVNSESAAPVQ
jgi:predicted  nucleic acid-binding Zn-ribbon protein